MAQFKKYIFSIIKLFLQLLFIFTFLTYGYIHFSNTQAHCNKKTKEGEWIISWDNQALRECDRSQR